MKMAEMTFNKETQCCGCWEHKVLPQSPVGIGAVMEDGYTKPFHGCGEFSPFTISPTGF